MLFVNELNALVETNQSRILKQSYNQDELLDVWISEDIGNIETGVTGNINFRKSNEGIFGEIRIPLEKIDGNEIERITYESYKSIFYFLGRYKEMKLVRVWNFIPWILKETHNSEDIEIYRCFNYGRFRAYRECYGETFEKWIIPAATAVSASIDELKIEFFASDTECVFLENKDQTPAYKYSEKYSKVPPLFSRGVIYKYKTETFLITSGTASIVNEETVYKDDVYNQVLQSIQNIRVLISQLNLQKYGIHYGFGLEDVELLRIYYKHEKDRDFIQKMINKIVDSKCKLSFMRADICRSDLCVEIEGVFRKKTTI